MPIGSINIRLVLRSVAVLLCLCWMQSAQCSGGNLQQQDGGSNRLMRFEDWDSVHHVVRRLMMARFDPSTGKSVDIDERIRGTPLAEAASIYTVLGRTRPSNHGNKLRFSLEGLISGRNNKHPGFLAPSILRAELRVLKTPAAMAITERQGSTARITVTSPTHRWPVGRSVVSLKHTSWEVIDVTEFVKDTSTSPDRAVDFDLHAHAVSGGERRRLAVSKLLQLSGDRNNTQRPVLVIYLKEPVEPLSYLLAKEHEIQEMTDRQRRSAMEMTAVDLGQQPNVTTPTSTTSSPTGDTPEISDRNHLTLDPCAIHSLPIKFPDIGWSHVVAPQGIDIKRCQGSCQNYLGADFSVSNHVILQSIWAASSKPESSIPKSYIACCIPTTLSSISLVVQRTDTDYLSFYTYHDAVVEECGCR